MRTTLQIPRKEDIMAGTFAGKVALVTGGNSGIGKATALAFAQEGAKVVIAARRVQEGVETVSMIKDAGGEALFIQTDVSKAVEVERMVQQTVEVYGRLDCAFNNAGISTGRVTMIEETEENFDQVIHINLKGVWLCMKQEIHQMLMQGSGTIVNDSSAAGLHGVRRGSTYAASKFGVIGLTKSAALEYAKQGIRVNAVCPGWIHTPMVERGMQRNPELETQIIEQEPVGRIGRPEEVAAAVLWLCSDAASFVTGIAMPVDGGLLA